MLLTLSYLTAIQFAAIYPAFLLLTKKPPIGHGFLRFNLGLCSIVAGVCAVGALLLKLPGFFVLWAVVWAAALLVTTSLGWQKEDISTAGVCIAVALGLTTLYQYLVNVWGTFTDSLFISVLGGAILAGALFAMVLGHWYLNVPGLPLELLKNTVFCFAVLLGMRLGYDAYILFAQKMLVHGYWQSLFYFALTMEGMLLWVGIFFGTAFPFILLYYVWGTLKVKSTQSATGILYTIDVAVIMGDFAYKYYLFKYGIVL